MSFMVEYKRVIDETFLITSLSVRVDDVCASSKFCVWFGIFSPKALSGSAPFPSQPSLLFRILWAKCAPALCDVQNWTSCWMFRKACAVSTKADVAWMFALNLHMSSRALQTFELVELLRRFDPWPRDLGVESISLQPSEPAAWLFSIWILFLLNLHYWGPNKKDIAFVLEIILNGHLRSFERKASPDPGIFLTIQMWNELADKKYTANQFYHKYDLYCYQSLKTRSRVYECVFALSGSCQLISGPIAGCAEKMTPHTHTQTHTFIVMIHVIIMKKSRFHHTGVPDWSPFS